MCYSVYNERKMRNFILLFFLTSIFQLNAQKPNWGDFKINPSSVKDEFTLQFDWLRENMFVKISDDGYTFTIGGDDIQAEYKYIIDEKVFKLQSVPKGQAYMNNKIFQEHKEKGFPIIGTDMQALRYFVIGFENTINDVYQLNQSSKNGFKDEGYSNGYGVELYGNGNAYIGAFKAANREGKGRYILVQKDGWQIMDGNFKNGVQHGAFIVNYSDQSKGHGRFVNGKVDGIWRYKYVDGSLKKNSFNNGAFVKEIKTEDNLHSQLTKDKDLTIQFIEDIKIYNSSPKTELKTFRFYEDDLKGYTFSFPYSMGLGGGAHKYKSELIEVEEDPEQRVETFEHYFKHQDGKSSFKVIFFKTPQKINNMDYRIVIHLDSEDFERKFYLQ